MPASVLTGLPPRSFLLGMAALLLLMTAMNESHAQDSDEVREAAMRDYHGDDMTGKDGPAAKAGMNLLLLYHAHQSGEISGASSIDDGKGVQVENGRVTVDIVAVDQGEVLVQRISDLGGHNVAARGRVVSAQIPISAIREVAMLDELQQMRPARAATRDTPKDPRNTLENAIAERGTTAVMSEDSENVKPSQQDREAASSETTEVPDAATNMESSTGSASNPSYLEPDIDQKKAANANQKADVQRSMDTDLDTSSREKGSGAIGFLFLVILILVLADPR